MPTYTIMLRVEDNDSIVSTTEKADSAAEAKQKAQERFSKLHKGKVITIIKTNPSK